MYSLFRHALMPCVRIQVIFVNAAEEINQSRVFAGVGEAVGFEGWRDAESLFLSQPAASHIHKGEYPCLCQTHFIVHQSPVIVWLRIQHAVAGRACSTTQHFKTGYKLISWLYPPPLLPRTLWIKGSLPHDIVDLLLLLIKSIKYDCNLWNDS